MRIAERPVNQPSWSTRALMIAAAAVGLLLPSTAAAQYSAPKADLRAIGERYHIELAGTLWNPDLFGKISSEQFRLIGSDIDVVNDLGYQKTRFKDFRIVLRPSKRSRFRVQYTPILYQATTNLRRSIVFNGQNYDLNLPVKSQFGWKVWRFGYEYDFLYKSRGFVGVLVEGRLTEFTAELTSFINSEFTKAKAPLPALGVVGRAYVLPEVAINFEVTGFQLPQIDPKYDANYFDWDINGTVNLTNYFGVQVGWRKMTNYLRIEDDLGDLRFKGLWFGAAIRY